jgi:DNA-binding NarL/FixJ family response regulator
VLVVDDHRTFAEALAMAIGLDGGFEVHIAVSGTQAVEVSAREHPDVVLMDVQMPGMDGFQTIRRIRETHAGATILVLSSHDEDLVKARALEAGAVGHMSKDTPLVELPELIRRAHAGELLMDPEEIGRLLRIMHHRRHQDATERQRAGRLSPRQAQILQLIADGIRPRQIAEQLNLTMPTLRTHVQNILTRLAVHTKMEAVAVAVRHGKIRPVSGGSGF